MPTPHPRPGRPLRRVRVAVLALVGWGLVMGAGGRCGGADDESVGAVATGSAPSHDAAGGTAARRWVTPSALALPPALAGQDPAVLTRAAELIRQARTFERQATRATAPDSEGAATPQTAASPDSALADSARRAYDAAAALVPDVADWLRLRRLALEPDPVARAQLAAALGTPAARERAPLVDADARLRAGDVAGAAAAYTAASRPAAALAARVRLTLAPGGNMERAAVRAALVQLAATAPTAQVPALPGAAVLPRGEAPLESARRAATLLDSLFAPLAPAERLTVARALGESRDPAARARTAAAYATALAAGVGTADDQLAYGRVLAQLGRWRDAVTAFARVPAGAPAAPAAAYERAHALLRAGDGAGARAALRQTAADFPRDSAAASSRFLLAELTADAGDEAAARAEYLRLARELPEARLAPAAAVRAGVLALAADDTRAALEGFDLAVAGWPSAPEAPAARYWAGRALAATGDSARARERWAAVDAVDGVGSYYGWLAARRLGRRAWAPTAGTAVRRDPVADSAARRAALCERLGMGAEAGWERDWIVRWADTVTARLLSGAAALVETGRPGPGIRMAQRAVEQGAERSADVWRLLYPLLYAGPLTREARAAGVDPALAAALIKQESNFTADAVSPVGARGLMQVMPSVGRSLWRGPGAWDAGLLFRPEVNLTLGMRHLDAALAGWADPAFALAAYNAGGSRVRRWQRQPGAVDPELFVERIPYAETRDYVRVVLRNREFYRALYRF